MEPVVPAALLSDAVHVGCEALHGNRPEGMFSVASCGMCCAGERGDTKGGVRSMHAAAGCGQAHVGESVCAIES